MIKNDEPVVEIKNLSKRYGDFLALDNLSLNVYRGQILGFIGPNGAGKTTTIKILVGLAKPTSGTARIAGVDCAQQSAKIKRLVGYMPDGFGAYDNMRVREYLDFFGAAFGIPRSERRTRIGEVLEITNATYMQDKYVESLSHGMQQRVGIARTLLHDPQVLIFDEPANGLDPQARIEMRELLLRLAANDKTLIVTSHILPELSRICDQVAIITGGKLRASGSLEKIMKDLSQRRMMEIQLTSSELCDQAAQTLVGLLNEDEPVSTSHAEAMIRFETARNDVELWQVLTGLVESGVQVVQYRELQADLEDAFLSVIRQGNKPSVNVPVSGDASLGDDPKVEQLAR